MSEKDVLKETRPRMETVIEETSSANWQLSALDEPLLACWIQSWSIITAP
jgi:hypothetical protein